MPNDWILEVLEDLRSFAELNDLPVVETEMERVIPVVRDALGEVGTNGSDALAQVLRRQS